MSKELRPEFSFGGIGRSDLVRGDNLQKYCLDVKRKHPETTIFSITLNLNTDRTRLLFDVSPSSVQTHTRTRIRGNL